MARAVGTASVIQITAAGGATYGVTLSAYVRGFSPEYLTPEVDVSVIGDGASGNREYLPGFKDGNVTFDGVWEDAIDLVMINLRGAGSASPVRYYPQGTASGMIYHTFEFVLGRYSPPTNMDEAVTFSASGRISGNVARGTA